MGRARFASTMIRKSGSRWKRVGWPCQAVQNGRRCGPRRFAVRDSGQDGSGRGECWRSSHARQYAVRHRGLARCAIAIWTMLARLVDRRGHRLRCRCRRERDRWQAGRENGKATQQADEEAQALHHGHYGPKAVARQSTHCHKATTATAVVRGPRPPAYTTGSCRRTRWQRTAANRQYNARRNRPRSDPLRRGRQARLLA